MKNIKDVCKEWQRIIYHSLDNLGLDMKISCILSGTWKFCENDEELIETIKELWGDEVKDSVELYWYLNTKVDKPIIANYSDDMTWRYYLVLPDGTKKDQNSPSIAEYKKMIEKLQSRGYDLEDSILYILETQKYGL